MLTCCTGSFDLHLYHANRSRGSLRGSRCLIPLFESVAEFAPLLREADDRAALEIDILELEDEY